MNDLMEQLAEAVDALKTIRILCNETLNGYGYSMDTLQQVHDTAKDFLTAYEASREQTEAQAGDAERLDFVLENGAFIWPSKADSGVVTYQLMCQDEDENFHCLHGESDFFVDPKLAVDAAIAKQKGEG